MQLTELQKPDPQRYVAPRRAVRAKLPRFLCQTDLEIRTDKNGKRYFICDECGVQAFVRRKLGITRLAKLVRALKRQKSKTNSGQKSPFGFSAALNEIDELKQRIKKLKNKNGFLSSDPDRNREIKALETRVSALLSMLEKHAKTVPPIAK